MSVNPLFIDIDNGDSPELFLELISAPFSIKSFAISIYPLLIDINKGVVPELFL